MTDQQPLYAAAICYDFAPAEFPGLRIAGRYPARTVSDAEDLCARLNSEFGAGTHWVEPTEKQP